MIDTRLPVKAGAHVLKLDISRICPFGSAMLTFAGLTCAERHCRRIISAEQFEDVARTYSQNCL